MKPDPPPSVKILHFEEVSREIEISFEEPQLNFEVQGIEVVTRIDIVEDENQEYDPVIQMVTWDEVLNWAIICCEDSKDAEKICARLREIADKVEHRNKERAARQGGQQELPGSFPPLPFSPP